MSELISCIMPTMQGRELFRSEAIACFDSQTWSNRELIIVDEPGTIGEKRNLAIERSKGELIAHWDDDDWSAPARLEEQMKLLTESNAEMVGFHSMEFFDSSTRRWLYSSTFPGYALGTSLLYRKSAWRRRPFENRNVGEDNLFIKDRNIVTAEAGELMRARIHRTNTSNKALNLNNRQHYKRIQ